MTTHETIGSAVIFHADFRDVLPGLTGVDAVLADPPYGIDIGKMVGGNRDRLYKRGPGYSYDIEEDDRPFDPAPLLAFPKVILWGGVHFASRLPESRCWLIWDKRRGATSDNQADCEMAWTNLDGPARLFHHKWRGMIRDGEENLANGARRLHPAQKPVALMTWCLSMLDLAPGATVLDTHMGSASAGVAAIRAGYHYIGIEKMRCFYDVSAERLRDECRQRRLIA